jgi:hypothetical protein
MKGHRFGVAAVTAVAVLVPFGSGSASAADHRVPVGNTPFDIPAEDCGFPIHVDVVEDKEYIVKTTENPDGSTSLRVTGRLILSYTNEITSKSIVRNTGGPGSVTFAADGAIFESQGRSAGFFSPAEQAATGAPGLQFVYGYIRIPTDADFAALSMTVHGRTEDGCALLS